MDNAISVFNFSSTHNGIPCITKPDAKRACDRVWFSVKQIELWSKMAGRTLYSRLHDLENCGRVSRLHDFASVEVPTKTGAVKTTIYNLNVLNQLAFVEYKNAKLNEVSKRFSDILSEVETTGKYELKKKDQKQELKEKENALVLAIVNAEDKMEAALAIREYKELVTTTERHRAFSSMQTASVKTRENNKLTAENTELKEQNEELKIKLQESTNYLCVKAIPWLSKYFIIPKEKESESVYCVVGKRLTALSKKLNYEIKNIPDPRYSNGVGGYHTDVIEIFRKQLDNDSTILAKYRI